jgi:hypothetical protein
VVFKRISSINYGFQVKICCIRHSSLLAYVFISRKLRIQTEIQVSDKRPLSISGLPLSITATVHY